MNDVMRHRLVSVRKVDHAELAEADNADQYMAWVGRGMAAGTGLAIFDRYPPDVTVSDDAKETTITHDVYVFSPEELADVIANVREQAMQEFLAVADGLAEEQENHDEQ